MIKSLKTVTWTLVLSIVVVIACKGNQQTASPDAHLFTVRGEVVQVPVVGNPGSQFIVHHEAIPGFIDQTGAVVGMNAMAMFFPTAEGLSLAGLRPGDKIRFILSVDWPSDRVEITKITKLRSDASLDFGMRPASADSAVIDSD